jgi:hypothetical protein
MEVNEERREKLRKLGRMHDTRLATFPRQRKSLEPPLGWTARFFLPCFPRRPDPLHPHHFSHLPATMVTTMWAHCPCPHFS